jgi:thiazole/oxazole-forming peptide maturase SagC family component
MHPAVEVIRVGERKWQLVGAFQRHTISAPVGFMEAIVHACSGLLTKQQIMHALESQYEPERVGNFLDFLITKKYLANSEAVQSDESLIEILDLQSRSMPAVATNSRDSRSLIDRTVEIMGTGIIAGMVREQLSEIGCRPDSDPEMQANGDFDVALVCADRVDHEFFRQVNRRMVAKQTAALFVALDGSRIIVGPFIDPPATACFECFHTRLRANARHLSELDARVCGEENVVVKSSASRLLARWSASVAVAKLAAHAAGVRFDHPAGEMLEIDGVTGRTETRRLIKLPRCGVCGPGGVERPRALIYEYET